MHPPELERWRAPMPFDPATEGARRGLSRDVSLALWEQALASVTDPAGWCDDELARRHFVELALRAGRSRLAVGRVTRAEIELGGQRGAARAVGDRQLRVPGRDTLLAAEARGEEALPELDFDDHRVLGLRQLLHQLGPDHALRRDAIAAAASADRSIAGRATRWLESLPETATPDGHALWQAAERRAATLYRRAMTGAPVAVPDPVVDAAVAQRGAGEPLAPELRRAMERELGVDLASVRIHRDGVAAQAARALAAEAFAVGEDIFFGDGMFAPDTPAGRQLLAHELTHVAQALHGRTAPLGVGPGVSEPGEPLEHEAEAMAARMARRETQAAVTERAVASLAPQLGLDAATLEIRSDQDAARRVASAGASGLMDGGVVYLAPDHYDASAERGRYLLAHELAHVAQSRLAPEASAPASRDAAEAEAAHIGQAWAHGAPFSAPKVRLPAGAAADTGAEKLAAARPTAQSDFVLRVADTDNFVVSFELLPRAGARAQAGAGGDVRVVISPTDFAHATQSLMKYWDVRGREVSAHDSYTRSANVGAPAEPKTQLVRIADAAKWKPAILDKTSVDRSGRHHQEHATIWTFDLDSDGQPNLSVRVDYSIGNTHWYQFTVVAGTTETKFDYTIIPDEAYSHGYQGVSAPRREQDDFVDFLGGILTSKATWEMAVTMIPVVGEVVMLGEAVTGYTIFGDKMSNTERLVTGLGALIPEVGGLIAKGVTKAGADLAKVAIKVGRSEKDVMALLRAAEKQGAEISNLTKWRATLKAGGKLTVEDAAELERVVRQLDADERMIRATEQGHNPTISASSPAEIYHGYGRLSARQQRLLDALPQELSRTTINKSAISLTDLAALTAATGDEFTVFTRGPQRMIVRGSPSGVAMTMSELRGLRDAGWKWSGHTHPGVSDLVLDASGGDRAVLEVFGQDRSAILNSRGGRNVFDATDNTRVP